ncbi:hypothetical protein NM688_g2566 [Phlebia brevispora]|uniref:Uncharacterized protein n=1 Tax=Phlebia brevispora TaxID=194682 RepID=A0ACC1T8G2_9APHY|nr:hypothetical protein NM688_g2566 [Phlebia brevispora]
MNPGAAVSRSLRQVWAAFIAAVGRLDKSLSPSDTIQRFRKHSFTLADTVHLFHIFLATFWLAIMQFPGFPLKLFIPILYTIFLLVPLTCQFFLPAVPVASWILSFYSNRFIPPTYRPSISVVLLPTLESVLYGANISDILTRFTHPLLDLIAWIPYGIGHYIIPFVVAAFLWLFRPKEALHQWARIFGYMNLLGVLIQILFPCAPPWYEVIHGLTPADYGMPDIQRRSRTLRSFLVPSRPSMPVVQHSRRFSSPTFSHTLRSSSGLTSSSSFGQPCISLTIISSTLSVAHALPWRRST